jgi:hypothetical protein
MRDGVRPADLDERFASGTARKCLSPLVLCELGLPTEADTAGLRPLAAFTKS